MSRALPERDFNVRSKQSLVGPTLLAPLALLAAFVIAVRGFRDVQTSGVLHPVFTLVGNARSPAKSKEYCCD